MCNQSKSSILSIILKKNPNKKDTHYTKDILYPKTKKKQKQKSSGD